MTPRAPPGPMHVLTDRPSSADCCSAGLAVVPQHALPLVSSSSKQLLALPLSAVRSCLEVCHVAMTLCCWWLLGLYGLEILAPLMLTTQPYLSGAGARSPGRPVWHRRHQFESDNAADMSDAKAADAVRP